MKILSIIKVFLQVLAILYVCVYENADPDVRIHPVVLHSHINIAIL